MAEPLSVIALVGLTLDILRSTIIIANSVRSVSNTVDDPKFIAVRAEFFTEQNRLALWVRYVDGQPGGREAITAHLDEMQKVYLLQFEDQAQTLLERATELSSKADPRSKKRIDRFKASIYWSTRGHVELKVLLDAIHKVNNALEKVVTPPPSYHGPIIGVSSFGRGGATASRNHQVIEETSHEETSVDTVQPPVTGRNTMPQPAFHIIHHLHRHSANALDKIEGYGRTKTALPSSVRLQRWGDTLGGPLSLDKLLDLEDDGKLVYEDLRQITITVFVDIILIEVCILTELAKDQSRPDLDRTILDVVACLAVDDATEIAASSATSISDFSDIQELLVKGIMQIERSIDGLYQLLPTIRMIRRGALLEAAGDYHAAASVVASASEDVTRRLLDTVDEIIQSSEKSLSLEDIESSVDRLSQKQIELLREYKRSQAPKLQGTDKKAANILLTNFIQGWYSISELLIVYLRAVEHKRSTVKGVQGEKSTTTSGALGRDGDTKLRERVLELVNNLPHPHTPV
ncbi:hypothetical protein NPX13_g8401 [Xylaria arbuscula]|uniref:Uncharacterized protein n=1 Tax=Xylaria arbuscula TaxID=114810 RepID=A0A9W8N911_9PEZI|nr:hypothetical protein NPX13_g8401 [Xylaria arbuscula]